MSNPVARFWMLSALMLAVLIRALVPAGYMPDLTSRQTFQMVVCSLGGLQTVTVDAGFDPHAGGGHDKAKPPCEFAALSHLPSVAVGITAIPLPVPTLGQGDDLTVAGSDPIADSRPFTTQPRGPPASV